MTSTEAPPTPTDQPSVPRRRLNLELLLVSLGLAVGIVLIVAAFATARTGGDAQSLPEGVELITPDRNDRVLRQAPISVTLTPGYCGRFTINGIAIPTADSNQPLVTPGSDNTTTQASIAPADVDDSFCGDPDLPLDGTSTVFDPSLWTLTYQPTEGAPIDKFGNGPQQVVLEFWKISDPGAVRRHTWVFNVDA